MSQPSPDPPGELSSTAAGGSPVGGASTKNPRRRPLSRPTRAVASFGPALAVLVVGIATLDVIARFRDSRGWVEHTRQVLAAAQGARTALVDIETGQRGFLIAGDSSYLAPFHSGLRAMREDTLRLRRLTSDNVAQQRRLNVLSPLILEHIALLDSSVGYQRDGGTRSLHCRS